ncbi:glycosyltransferase [candidate division KSB1 bacterium]|nr:MAG: glycosyltransferase [candidate division KSB1 bacterium]
MAFRIVITTTLNDNLFHAKLVPLLRARPDVEIVVVSDRSGPPLERVKWVWPQGLWKRLGRLGGRLPLLMREMYHPDTRLAMTYNVIPHGLFVVLLTRLRRLPVYLHFISGEAEVIFAHNPLVSGNRRVQHSKHPQRWEKLARWVARRAKRICVPGTNTAAALKRLGFKSETIIHLHSTIDPQRFFPGDGTRDIDILVAAQLTERKRPLYTLDIFYHILQRRPGTRFCWLGDGPLHAEFAAARDRLGLQDALLWTETNDVAPYYRRARVFLLCSIREGLSLACMEAMGCGLVPVATDCGDMVDIVHNQKTGTLLPVEATIEEFASAILQYLDHEKLWSEYSRNACEIIAQEHSFDSAEKVWRELLKSFPE